MRASGAIAWPTPATGLTSERYREQLQQQQQQHCAVISTAQYLTVLCVRSVNRHLVNLETNRAFYNKTRGVLSSHAMSKPQPLRSPECSSAVGRTRRVHDGESV